MPRKPKIRILSPSDPRLQEKNDPLEYVPTPLVRGLIRGLLNHCWSSDRRPTKEGRIDQVRLEDMLMTGVELTTKNCGAKLENVPQLYAHLKKPDDSDDLQEWFVAYFAAQVPQVFQSFTGHHPFLFVGERDLLLEHTDRYFPIYDSTAVRKQWLEDYLPQCTAALKGCVSLY